MAHPSPALVAVVDDDESIRESLRGLIRSIGLRVETFPSAEAFSRSAALGKTDCLILDVRMPGMSGLELQRELATGEHDIPIIFITAHGSDEGVRAGALRDGAVAYLSKPFSEDALLEAVTAALNA
ncbi:MAG: two-component system response regulator [Gemmatimonadetes bacterium]|nr:MAG: two-component system response regulator [Gemmatimonadota bacterium]